MSEEKDFVIFFHDYIPAGGKGREGARGTLQMFANGGVLLGR